MSMINLRIAHVMAISALALGLAACGPNNGETAGQKLDNSIERTEQAADNARVEADRAAQAAGQKMDNAVDASKNAANDAMAVAGEAGTTAKVNAALIGDPELSALKINVDTVGSTVTLNGEAPSQSAKDRATDIAKAVEGVTSVNNLLTVK
ncbi:MAG: BON domain-containing protein [Comamonas sp.]|nr:BON domain-containing protein [Comamonas sp.]